MQRVRLVPFLVLLGSSACGAEVHGRLFIDTGSVRTLEYAPERCADGDAFGYFGVRLRDDEDRLLEFFRNGGEAGLAFYAPGSAAFELAPADCTHLRGDLVRQHNETTDAGEVEGSLELDCEAPNGWTLHGRLTFEGCTTDDEDEDEDECDDPHDDPVVSVP
jgi:hypothetical protein